MVFKKLKKSATLTSVVLSIILVIGIFTGMFLWLNINVTDTGVTLDEKYTESFSQLNGSTQSSLINNIDEIKTSFIAIGEANDVWKIAWNGLKALGSTLKLPISFLSTALTTMNITFISMDYLPEWFKILAGAALTAVILFVVISLLKGESKM